MANVLKDEKKQQIIALGRLGWSLRKIQEATRVRRETISAYLRGAGVEIWPPGRWKREGKAKPAIQVITGSEAAKPAIPESGGHPNLNPNPDPKNLSTKGKAKATSKPAIGVITDFGVGLSGKEPENSKVVGSASTCQPYREIIELGLSRDRNAMAIWQDLVSGKGNRSVARLTSATSHRKAQSGWSRVDYRTAMPRLFAFYLPRVLVPDRRKIEDTVKKAIQ
jgi:hypothetical protein